MQCSARPVLHWVLLLLLSRRGEDQQRQDAAAIAAFAAGFGIGKIGKSTMEAIARQPESAGNLRTSMIIAAGMVEGAALFAIIVALLAILIK